MPAPNEEEPNLQLDLSDSTPRQQRLRGWLLSSRRFVKAHPTVLLTPLLVLAALLAAGTVGVLILSNAIKLQRQEDAVNEAGARGIIISEKIQMALVPVHGLANAVLDTPDYSWPSIQKSFNSTALSMLKLLSGTGLGTQMILAIAPAGIVWGSVPLQGNEASIYHDLLADPKQRDSSLAAIRNQSLTLSGPFPIKQGYVAATVRLPVFVSGSYGPNYTFGLPPSPLAPHGNTPYNCPDCYGAQRFWGFCSSILNWDVIRAATSIDNIYSESGYSFRLTRPAQATESDDYILAESPDMTNQTFDDPVHVTITVLTNEWTLTMSRQGGWYPSWRTPMIVVVVIVSLVLSLLIGLVMGWNCVLMETTARLKITAQHLQLEKERMDVLLARQYDLIHCFADVNAPDGGSGSAVLGLKIDRLRNSLKSLQVSSTVNGDKIELHEQLGSGNFGKVYRGTWRGTNVAVKCIVLPSSMSRSAHAERMVLMETAISSSMHHPHLVQTYTYSIKPIKDSSDSQKEKSENLLLTVPADSRCVSAVARNVSKMDSDSLHWSEHPCDKDMHSFEIQLVLEYCDGGSLDQVLKSGGFHSDGVLNIGGILDTAADVAKGMLHLHINEILHSDLKAGNVMFKTGGDDGRGVMAKVVDFGLSIQLDISGNQTHVSKMFQGTLTHMAPEVLLMGMQSKAADVYSFGIMMYELYTGKSPYAGVATALLGHYVAREGRRPQFGACVPQRYRELAERCWQGDPDLRPTFTEILAELQTMRISYPSPKPIVLPAKPLKLPHLPTSPHQAHAHPSPTPLPPHLPLPRVESLDKPTTPNQPLRGRPPAPVPPAAPVHPPAPVPPAAPCPPGPGRPPARSSSDPPLAVPPDLGPRPSGDLAQHTLPVHLLKPGDLAQPFLILSDISLSSFKASATLVATVPVPALVAIPELDVSEGRDPGGGAGGCAGAAAVPARP